MVIGQTFAFVVIVSYIVMLLVGLSDSGSAFFNNSIP